MRPDLDFSQLEQLPTVEAKAAKFLEIVSKDMPESIQHMDFYDFVNDPSAAKVVLNEVLKE